MTRIDRLLGTQIFESIQDSVPRSIDLMIGMAHTSGKLVTGKRRYATCKACRELINPCFLKRAYVCGGCRLRPSQLCTGAAGNLFCERSDKEAGEDARKTGMTVLYRCHFGLANYAIAAPIGELGSIILYGGQFHIGEPSNHEVLVEEIDESGKTTCISESDFRELVLAIDDWRLSREKTERERERALGQSGSTRNYSAHLSFAERDDLLREYLEDSGSKKNITVVIDEEPDSLGLCELENLLRRRYNLSLFEPWRKFLSPKETPALEEAQVRANRNDLNSRAITFNTSVKDSELKNAAEDALEKYDTYMNEFLNNPSNPAVADYRKAVVPLGKVLSTIELLRNLSVLISRTADIIFYKDTYLRLKGLWDSHPVSITESFDEKWRECAAQLQQLRTIGREVVPHVKGVSETANERLDTDMSEHQILVKKLNRSLMLFAYKLLFEDFNSVISMLLYNHEIASEYEKKEPKAISRLLAETEIGLRNMITASCLFVRELLEAKYEQLVKDSSQHGITEPSSRIERAQTRRELDKTYDIIKNISSDAVERISDRLEGYSKSGGTKSPDLLDASIDVHEITALKKYVFGLLQRTLREKWIKTREDWIKEDDVMLRFFGLVFEGVSELESELLCARPEEEEKRESVRKVKLMKEHLSRIGANLKWADAEIRGQLEHIPTSVLQFDVCQSMLRFVQKLKEFVHNSRFNALKELAARASENGFEVKFMDPKEMTVHYFIDHGINHVRRVLENVETLIDFAQDKHLVQQLSGEARGKISEDSDKENEWERQEAYEKESFLNVCKLPIWQYYAKCAALFHDVGMFGERYHEEVYGGPGAVRRCHGAFSGKRISQQRRFDIIGTDVDKRLVAQICTFHQGAVDMRTLHKNIQPLVAILRIADEFHVGEDRMLAVDPAARNGELRVRLDKLQTELKGLDLRENENKDLVAPEISFRTTADDLKKQEEEIKDQVKKVKMFEERISALVEKYKGDEKGIWSADAPCFELVHKNPKLEARLEKFFSILKNCSEIRTLLEATLHYQKHLSVQNVDIKVVLGRSDSREKRLVPVITLATSPKHQGIIVPPSDQPWIVAERVKAKFLRELDTVMEYLETVGIRFMKPRTSSSRNLLFINSPTDLKAKFVGAPTSLLYAISQVSSLIDADPSFMDVNIDVWDPIQFTVTDKNKLRDMLAEFNPKIVGISNTSAGHSTAIDIAKVVRKELPSSIIIFGGAHENVSFFETMERSVASGNDSYVDISIGGVEEPVNVKTAGNTKSNDECCADTSHSADGEYVLREIVMGILGEDLSRENMPDFLNALHYDQLQGNFSVAFLGNDGKPAKKVCKNKLNTDELSIQPRHLLDESSKYDYEIFKEEITGKRRKTAQVITTRGCIHRCTFCSSVGKSARRSVGSVMKELRKLKEEGYRAIFFDDSTFADKCGDEPDAGPDPRCSYTGDLCPRVATQAQLDEEKTKALKEKGNLPRYVQGSCGYAVSLCDAMFTEDLGFVWGCQTRADVVCNNDNLLNLMKKAGCIYVYFGVESLKDTLLRSMCKKISPKEMTQGIMETRNKGMNVGISLVFGLEGEDENSIRHTIGCVSKLFEPVQDPSSRVSCVSINIATVYPGTKLHDRFKDKAPEHIPNYDEHPKFDKYPYNEFEDGGRNLLPCCVLRGNNIEAESQRLARIALEECRKTFGKPLV